MQERGGENLAAGGGSGTRKEEAEWRAITEEELTEAGTCLGQELRGNQKSGLAPSLSG